MIKRMMLVVGMMLVPMLPGAAMAQHAGHHDAKHKEAVSANFADQLIHTIPDLKLTPTQITKLQAIGVRMEALHKEMQSNHHPDAATKAARDKKEAQIHEDLLAVFTKDQVAKVEALLQAHHGSDHGKKSHH